MENLALSMPTSVETYPLNVIDCLDAVCSSPLFAGLSESVCYRIASTATRHFIPPNRCLLIQKGRVRNFVLLENGNVKLTEIDAHGSSTLLRVCGPGDIIEGAGLSGIATQKCSARAIEESTLLSWRSEVMRSYMQSYSTLAINFSQVLYARLSDLESRVRELTSEEITRRTALLLVRLGKKVGKSTEEGIRIVTKQEDIAQMTGLSVFTISRMLSKWCDRGLVITRREAVIIPNLRRLADPEETKIAHPASVARTSSGC